MKRYANKTIVITGATGGLGVALAKELDLEGAVLVLLGRNYEKLDCLKKSLQSECIIKTFDFSSIKEVESAAAFLKDLSVDVLINNAGIQEFGPLVQKTIQNITNVFQTNVIAPTCLVSSVLPAMIKRNNGHIINIGSIFGSIAYPYFSLYSASKSALRGLSESLRREVGQNNVLITYIAPRAMDTALNGEVMHRIAKATKMSMDSPADIAKIIVKAMKQQKKEVYIGFPERFFVKLNYWARCLVDNGLKKETQLIKQEGGF